MSEVTPDDAARDGAAVLLSSYVGLRKGESLLLLFDDAVGPSVVELLAEQAVVCGGSVKVTPFVETEPFDASAAGAFDALLFVQQHDSLYSAEVAAWISAGAGRTRCYRLFGASHHTLRECFRVSREEQEKINYGVLNALVLAQGIRVTSAAGTDLTLVLEPRYSWMSVSGNFTEHGAATLPAGEVSTYSPSVTGRFVADGCLNANMDLDLDPRLADAPVTIEVDQSVVQHFETDNVVLRMILDQFFSAENATQVGEVGFSTNLGIERFASVACLANERFPGFHLGLGEHQQTPERVSYHCPLHLDLIAKDPTVKSDSHTLFAAGTWKHMSKSRMPGLLVGEHDII